jgi:hypothetical protein
MAVLQGDLKLLAAKRRDLARRVATNKEKIESWNQSLEPVRGRYEALFPELETLFGQAKTEYQKALQLLVCTLMSYLTVLDPDFA